MNTTVLIIGAGAALFAAWCCEMLACENRRLRARAERWEEMVRSLDRKNDNLTGDLLSVCGQAEKRASVYHREALPCERN